MSVKQMALVWDLELEHSKKYVLLAYADHADDDGDNVYPSLGRMAHKTGYSRDQIRRISRHLVNDGLMVLVTPADAAARRPARYRLTLENGNELGPFKPRSTSGTVPLAPPSPLGANDPPPLGAPMPPEPSLEPSVKNPEEAKAPSGQSTPAQKKGLSWEEMDTNRRQSYLLAYLYERLTERELTASHPLTPAYKSRLAGELRLQIQTGARKADLLLVLDRIIHRWPERRLHLYEAMNDTDGEKRRHLRAVEEPPRPRKRVIT